MITIEIISVRLKYIFLVQKYKIRTTIQKKRGNKIKRVH